MTHEYVVALGGRIEGVTRTVDGRPATAIAWAADGILAVGPDDVVAAVSRGDSLFLDLAGAMVRVLADEAPGALEVGAPADLAFEADDGRRLATLRAGRFTDADPRAGPFERRRP